MEGVKGGNMEEREGEISKGRGEREGGSEVKWGRE